MRTTRGWIARTAIVAAAMGLLASACSSGRGEASNPLAGGETTPAVAPKAEGSFGNLEPICTSGDASGATAQGVTDTSIKIGFGDDAGFISAPGLNHEMSDAMRAFVGWCNDLGGINGRKIDATYYDAKITEVNNVWLDACSKEFYMVGQGFALDSAQEQTRRGCGLPSVAGYAVSPPFSNGPLHHEPTPVPADYTITSAGAQLAKLFPEQITHAAVVHGDFAAMYDTRDKVVPAFESLGYSFDCNQQYALQGEADWKPFAQKLKDCGIEFVYFIGSPYPNFENLLVPRPNSGSIPSGTSTRTSTTRSSATGT